MLKQLRTALKSVKHYQMNLVNLIHCRTAEGFTLLRLACSLIVTHGDKSALVGWLAY